MIKLNNNQRGAIGHIEILVIVLVVVLGGFAAWRVIGANDSSQASVDTVEEIEQLEVLPADLDGLKTIEEIEEISGANVEGVTIIGFVLESKDSGFVYIVTLSNGQKLVIDASSGTVLSEETTDVSDDDKIPSGLSVTISPSQAYTIASAQSTSAVVQIELEVEDDKVTYKVELKDGSKVEIDATTGNIVTMEIKDEESSSSENEAEGAEYEEVEDSESDEYEAPETEEEEEPES